MQTCGGASGVFVEMENPKCSSMECRRECECNVDTINTRIAFGSGVSHHLTNESTAGCWMFVFSYCVFNDLSELDQSPAEVPLKAK